MSNIKSKMPPKSINYSNMFDTPDYAIKPLLPLLNPNWIIWECACGDSNNITEYLIKNGFKKVIPTDILTGIDFFKHNIPCDCIITNPPYEFKTEFLIRCYEIGKPFALLMPLTTIETAKRQQYFQKYGASIITFDKRINYGTPKKKKKSSAWFQSAWFTYKLNIPEAWSMLPPINLYFTKIEREEI
jgi:hypothetical protein